METTPSTRIMRPRHTPTPKMSDRKKKLFTTTRSDRETPPTTKLNTIADDDEDSDLGPMSPLQFSSSPSSYGASNGRGSYMKNLEHRTDFRNVMVLLSPINKNKYKMSSVSRRILSPNSSPLKNDQLADNETIPNNAISNVSKKLDDCVSEFGENDKENSVAEVLKTPGTKANTSAPRISYHKSIIFDTGLTPNDGSVSPTTRKYLQKRTDDSAAKGSESTTKAKTSLSFTEISTKSFYGSSDSTQNIRKPKPLVIPIKQTNSKRHRRTASCVPVLGRINRLNRRKLKPLKSKKSSLSTMSKDKLLETAYNIILKSPLNHYLKSKSEEEKDLVNDSSITKAQLQRIEKILKNQRNPLLEEERPLNWNVGEAQDSQSKSTNETADFSSSQNSSACSRLLDTSTASENSIVDDVSSVVDDAESDGKKRKFFKSKTNRQLTKYQVTSTLCATVKRGADGTSAVTLMAPKPKKPKNNKLNYDELLYIQQEVSDIISRLPDDDDDTNHKEDTNFTANTSLVSNESLEQQLTDENNLFDQTDSEQFKRYSQMLPYQTSDPEIIERQRTILELLVNNNICTDENFRIFIAEPDAYKEEANRILDQLFQIEVVPETDDDAEIAMDQQYFTNSTTVVAADVAAPMSPDSQISDMTSSLVLDCPNDKNDSAAPEKLFPLFYKKSSAANTSTSTTRKSFANIVGNNLKKWKPIGDRQYQIDAGQKEFGGKLCNECGLYYTVHEPEEEIMHETYHNSLNLLRFKGWNKETILENNIYEWGPNGRIIVVQDTEIKVRWNRVMDILNMIDKNLGFCETSRTLKPRSMVYLAIAKNQVIGVCVAEPLSKAHGLVKVDGIDCMDTTTTQPVKCGISRLWIAPPFRRYGVATKLIETLRSHFIFYYRLNLNELAFSSPTEMGLQFIRKLTANILVYSDNEMK